MSNSTLDQYVQERMYAEHIPGLAIAIVRGAEIILQRGYGFANLEYRSPVTADSVFEICSISKQFTVAAAMLLIEAGLLEVDHTVHSYLPNLPEVWQNITVRHLLTATSGIKDYLDDIKDGTVPVQESSQMVVKYVSTHDLNFPPGERWAYSNSGFVLLSLLIEQRSGLPYRDFLQSRILAPLQMYSTYANDLRQVISNRVAGYVWEDAEWRNRRVFFAGKQSNGDGELVSTLTDLIKWDAAWRSNRFLLPSSLQQVWTPAMVNSKALAQTMLDTHYGFGWFLGEYEGHRTFWTPGAGDGFSTTLMRFPDDDLTVIVLSNRDEFLWADTLARGIGTLVW
jgi:CubicO group peptidase (beta-lactamase class C family)